MLQMARWPFSRLNNIPHICIYLYIYTCHIYNILYSYIFNICYLSHLYTYISTIYTYTLYIYYISHTFFTHSSVDNHLGYFHILAIVSNTAVYIGVQVSEILFSFPLGVYWGIGFLGHMALQFLIFWGTTMQYSIIAVLIGMPKLF